MKYMSHSQKSATFCFDKSAKNVKNDGSKIGKEPFWFARSITKVLENVGFNLAKHSKFDVDLNLWK